MGVVSLDRGPTIIGERYSDYHFFCMISVRKKRKIVVFFFPQSLVFRRSEFGILTGSSAMGKESSVKSSPAPDSLIVRGVWHWSEHPMLRARRTQQRLHGPWVRHGTYTLYVFSITDNSRRDQMS